LASSALTPTHTLVPRLRRPRIDVDDGSTQVAAGSLPRLARPAQLGRVRPRFTAVFTFLGTTAYVFTGPLNRDQVQVLTRIGASC